MFIIIYFSTKDSFCFIISICLYYCTFSCTIYRLAALDERGSGRGQESGARMRRFRQEDYRDDSDDDTKQTYNGNSTQQQ